MKRFAVAYADADGGCVVEIVKARSWLYAIQAHSCVHDGFLDDVEEFYTDNDESDAPDVEPTLEDAQSVANDQDFSVDVKEIPNA